MNATVTQVEEDETHRGVADRVHRQPQVVVLDPTLATTRGERHDDGSRTPPHGEAVLPSRASSVDSSVATR